MAGTAKTSLRFTAVLEKSTNKLWGSHLRVPAAIAQKLLAGGSRRVLRTLNSSEAHQCALLPFGEGTYVLSVNKKLCNELRLEIGSKVRVSVQPDNSKYGLPVPPELTEWFRQDRNADKLFHALTPGKQRTLLYMIGTGRTEEDRAWKAGLVVRHLREHNGVIHYRQLYLSFRKR